MGDTTTKFSGGGGEWLSLAACAADVGVDLEVVRRWCVAWEGGNPDGLRSCHFGSELDAAKAKRRNRRVHIEDWRAFKSARRRQDQRQEREITRRLEAEPRDFPTRQELRERRAVVAGQGR
jgi:hypothetical protein